MKRGLYVHWPYCRRICPYCDFNVRRWRGDREEEKTLLAAILADIAGHGRQVGRQSLHSVHFGGGTPSLLGPAAIAQILEAADAAFGLEAGAEIGLEANPEDRMALGELAKAGINRFSLGIQAFDDGALAQLGRGHASQEALEAVDLATRTGARISLDLIHSRPGQNLQDWEQELRRALNLQIGHISLYQLTFEAGTPFFKALAGKRIIAPDAEEAAEFLELTQAVCAEAGFANYEISNYARTPADRSLHNLLYWRGQEWIGVGPGAHGRIQKEGQRLATNAWRGLKPYIAEVASRGLGWESAQALSAQAQGEELVLMGLRLHEGLELARAEILLGFSLDCAALLQGGWAHHPEPGRLALTASGRLIADRIATELLLPPRRARD